jgi:hypothetical protein
MKTIAQQLNIKEFPFEIKDSHGNMVYLENSTGEWVKWEYDSRGNVVYWEDSKGDWSKREYDSNGNEVYLENSTGEWVKWEYDSNGNEVYFEDSDGLIKDNRPKKVELTLDEIADKFGINVSQLKIKK